MQTLKFLFVIVLIALGSAAHALDRVDYGSFAFYPEMPGTLFLTGQIATGDSFELRRAMRDQDISIVVTASPGGNLYEGLQIAPILHDNEIGTFIPAGASCESSCANIFLGGEKRLVIGELGVHQFYTSDGSGAVNEETTIAVTQYTTSDIIGIMNGFDTPPFVYEKMFGTREIYYFTASEKPRLNLKVDDETFTAQVAAVEAFVAANASTIEQRPGTQTYAAPAAKAPTAPAPSTDTTGSDIERIDNVDFFGMDLSPNGHRYVSLSACEALCRGNPDCAAWSYVVKSEWCWTKSGVENLSYAPGTVSGVVNPSRVNMAIFDRPFEELSGHDIPGYDLVPTGIRNTSLAECRDACAASSSCLAFSWVAKKNMCFPKYGASGVKKQLGVVSGVKK